MQREWSGTSTGSFGRVFNEGAEVLRDGSQFDHLFADGDTYCIGKLTVFAMPTPGHMPACTTPVVGDAAFVGDALFMPNWGTACADFPGGDGGELYQSIKRILAVPPQTKLFMCHDYAPNGRATRRETTVGDERAHDIHVHDGLLAGHFEEMRTAQNATRGTPRPILPSFRVNMRGGKLPPAEDNGRRYLKIPSNAI